MRYGRPYGETRTPVESEIAVGGSPFRPPSRGRYRRGNYLAVPDPTAQAGYVTIPFDFETLTPSSTTSFNATTANTAITNFAQNILTTDLVKIASGTLQGDPNATVSITGAAATNSYTADGHVVKGPNTWTPNGNTSYTLANKDGKKTGTQYNGTFLINNQALGGTSQSINFNFCTSFTSYRRWQFSQQYGPLISAP